MYASRCASSHAAEPTDPILIDFEVDATFMMEPEIDHDNKRPVEERVPAVRPRVGGGMEAGGGEAQVLPGMQELQVGRPSPRPTKRAHREAEPAPEGVVKPGLPDHPKVAHLADRLGIEEAHALGILVRLWDRVGTTQDSGILRGWTARDYARQVAWKGSADALLEALHAEHWLDLSAIEPNLYLIHDWPEEAPRHVALKWVRTFKLSGDSIEARARAQMRAIHDLELGRADRSVDDRRSSNDRSPITPVLIGSDLIGTDLNGTRTPTPAKPEARKKPNGQYSDDFEAFWNLWPTQSRVGKGAASLKWGDLTVGDRQVAVQAVAAQTAPGAQLDPSRPHGEDGRSKLPHPSTWLHQRRFEDSVAIPPPAAQKDGSYVSRDRFEHLDYGPDSTEPTPT